MRGELKRLAFDLERLGGLTHLVGVDEAGRGPLAGPVVAGAVALSSAFYALAQMRPRIEAFNDSKQISEAKREELFALLHAWVDGDQVRLGVGVASVEEIATHNILGATRLAMGRAIAGLGSISPTARILIDGRPHKKDFAYAHEGLVKGDSLSLAIAMASIVAKVTRDRLMLEVDRRYPQYGFAAHKGYGTPTHVAALKAHGPCPEHRALFLRKILP